MWVLDYKKAEYQRIDAFELWCWRRLLRVPWTARRSNQSILKEISLGVHWRDWCWSWNSNTLATWWEELTHLKAPDAGKDWGQEEKGMTEDEMFGWHHWLNGHGFGWTPGVGDGQGGLACCGSWGRKESDTTERLNWTELNHQAYLQVSTHWLHWVSEKWLSQGPHSSCSTACEMLVAWPGIEPAVNS